MLRPNTCRIACRAKVSKSCILFDERITGLDGLALERRLTAVLAADVDCCPHGGRMAALRTSWD